MTRLDVPQSERNKLYPYISDSIIPSIIVTVVILLTLFFGGTNVVVFYVIPWLVQIIFLQTFNVEIFLDTLGLVLRTKKQKLFGFIFSVIGAVAGWGLVKWATSGLTFFKIATYPWVQTTLSSVGLLATYTEGQYFWLYIVVAFFEESLAIIFGKSWANFIHRRFGGNKITISIIGYFIGRIILTSHHWFAYQGISQPGLYLSALLLFCIFSLLGVLAGVFMAGRKLGEDLDQLGYLPISILPMMTAHFMFDFVMSRLSIFVDVSMEVIRSAIG